ncbi:YidB family protein [Pseudohalioglobus lutimaris]|uniref:DUF937 domain-containing protein n=1 Tax=Pseudohalioglobus lutimaris TaxID=1737061 RepID=A0A2N5X8F6_9GAMM|nr:YidB family protein [Pseudohalioglobus lutimaris]PLW70784.1 hypothetical protein C0039_01235 [Pseudohalioglobus lutimaris]
MDIVEMGAQMLSEKLGVQVDTETVKSALSNLLGDGQGNIDLAALTGKLAASGGLASVVGSWLGDGGNSPISASSLESLLGENAVADFASSLGTDTATAAGGLADVLPQMVDKASSGGSLLDAAGGLDGLMGAAKSFLR